MQTQNPVESALSTIARDEEGFLLNSDDWTPSLARQLANEQDLDLSGEVRDIVMYVRDYFQRHRSVPEARVVLRFMRDSWGEEKATRRYLYRLFPYGYGQQACKIAGMVKPRKIMLDV